MVSHQGGGALPGEPSSDLKTYIRKTGKLNAKHCSFLQINLFISGIILAF